MLRSAQLHGVDFALTLCLNSRAASAYRREKDVEALFPAKDICSQMQAVALALASAHKPQQHDAVPGPNQKRTAVGKVLGFQRMRKLCHEPMYCPSSYGGFSVGKSAAAYYNPGQQTGVAYAGAYTHWYRTYYIVALIPTSFLSQLFS